MKAGKYVHFYATKIFCEGYLLSHEVGVMSRWITGFFFPSIH